METVAKKMSFFERYLSVWVALSIVVGIGLGKLFPSVAGQLDRWSVWLDGAPVISIPIAICLFLMMYPIMVKIDFGEVLQAGRSYKPVVLTLIINWCVKPFTMLLISQLFLGWLFLDWIGADSVDLVTFPAGWESTEAMVEGGQVVVRDGVRYLQVPLWRSYLAGCLLLGIAPCTAMVLVWSYLADGSNGHTLVMVAVNSLVMLALYGALGGLLLGIGQIPVPWRVLFLSIGVYVALPLVSGWLSRRWLLKWKGKEWFKNVFLRWLSPVTIAALLTTLVILFSLRGESIVAQPWTILWIAIPLAVQTILIFSLGYAVAYWRKFRYEDAAPTAMIGASNHFEVAIATAAMMYGLGSGAALATVVGVLIEVPLMLLLVRICVRTRPWFDSRAGITGVNNAGNDR